MQVKTFVALFSFLLVTFFVVNNTNFYNKNIDKEQVTEEKPLNFMLIGDYGSGTQGQKDTAEQLNKIAEQTNSQFIIGSGDNFYEPNGVDGLDDPQWDVKWADVYQNKSYLKDLTWYGTIGNHDFGGEGLFSEFEYNKHGWRIDDFFWAHTHKIGDQNIVFIHVDTSFLAYGVEGQDSKPLMKSYFQELNWNNNQQMLDYAEELILLYLDYDWKFVVGHHQIGHSCMQVKNTHLFYDLFQKYKIDAYLSGHAHILSYTQHEDMGFILSGAGGYPGIDPTCFAVNPMWAKQQIFGFMGLELQRNQLDITAYYKEEDSNEWKQKKMVPLTKRK